MMHRTLCCLIALPALSALVVADELRVSDLPRSVSEVPVISGDQLTPAQWEQFSPVSPQQLESLLENFRRRNSQRDRTVSRAEYSARLMDRSFSDGKLRLEFPEGIRSASVSLGRTNLRDLRLYSENDEVPLALSPELGLQPILSQLPESLIGTWSADGVRRGRSLSFELSLPEAEVATFTLTTDAETRVRSPNALVRMLEESGDEVRWLLLPNDPLALTIDCSARADARNDVAYLNIESEVRLYEDDADVSWSIVAPEVLAGSAIRFSLRGNADIAAVRMAETELSYQVLNEGDASYLEITLPSSLVAAILVNASFPATGNGVFDVPFLVPGTYAVDGTQTGILVPRMPTIRATVGPDDAISSLSFKGLYEQDVTFPSDGSQVLELQQYVAEAELQIALSTVRPLVEDEVVVRVQSKESVVAADAFVRIGSRSGSISQLSWEVPANWRVTDVRESGPNGAPLLFRVSSEDARQPTQLEVNLRQPVVAGGIAQRLFVRMQAVEGTLASQQRPAWLTSSRHDRLTDIVALPAEIASPLVDSWTSGPLTEEDRQEKLPWLEIDELAGLNLYDRADLSVEDLPDAGSSEIRASLEYSAVLAGGTIRQVAEIRLASDGDLPAEISFTVAGDVTPVLEGPTGNLSLDQVTSGEESNWVLSVSPEIASTRSADFSLVHEAAASASVEGMVVRFNDCIQTGRIQPPALDDGFDLRMTIDGRAENVVSPVEYPASLFQLSLESRQPRDEATFVSGRGFLSITRELSRVRANALCRCIVQPGRRSSLSFRASCGRAEVHLDGRPVYVTEQDGLFVIPVDPDIDTIEVDVFLTHVGVNRSTIGAPLIDFDAKAEVDWYLLSSRDHLSISSEGGQSLSRSRVSSHAAADLIFDMRSGQKVSNRVRAFAGRWRVQSREENICLFVPAAKLNDAKSIQLKVPVPSWFWSVLAAVAMFVAWQFSGLFTVSRMGGVLLAMALMRLGIDSLIVNGMIIGSVGYVGYRMAARCLTEAVRYLRQRYRAATITLPLLVILPLAQDCSGQVLSGPPPVFSVDRTGSSPFVYVQKSLLDRLMAAARDEGRSLAVLESHVEATLDSESAGSAVIRTLVVGRRDQKTTLSLPLKGVTLVTCRLDGAVAFPRSNANGTVSIEVPPEAQLPAKTLSIEDPVAAAGPRTIGVYLLREVEYEVRFSADVEGGQYRLRFPVPESPRTYIRLSDPNTLIASAGLQDTVAATPDAELSETDFRFPVLSNASAVDLVCVPVDLSVPEEAVYPDAGVVSIVDVLADRLLITTEYRLKRDTTENQSLTLDHASEQVVSVRVDGNPSSWTALGDGISIPLETEPSDELIVLVRQEVATDLSLKKRLSMDQLRTINGKTVENLTLVLRTSDQFIWQEILGDDRTLPTAPTPVDPELVRPMERRLLVPKDVDTVSLAITERISSRLVSVSQQGTVDDDSVRWRCDCDFEISGQPAFRQTILLDSAVRVQSVEATLAGSDRLQSWTRTPEGVIVSLREATRGNLRIRMQGSVPRSTLEDTRLPVVEFPAGVEVLQASLDLSSRSTSGAFVSSFGGARPDAPFDVGDQIPEDPIRLSVIDDRQPLVIRRSVRQRLDLEIVALLYESAGQLRVATAVSIAANDGLAPLRFRSRGADLDSQRPVVVRGQQPAKTSVVDDTVIISPAELSESPERTIVILPNAIPVSRDATVQIQTPEFDVPSTVTSLRCYDLRNSRSRRQNTIPRWVQERATELDMAAPAAGVLRLSQFDDDTRRVLVRLPRQTSNIIPPTGSADVVYVDCEHRIEANEIGFRGVSGFLVFASQSRSQFVVPPTSGIDFARVRVNGRTAVMKTTDGQLEVQLPTAVCHITLEWMFTPPSGMGMLSYIVPVPNVPYQRSQNRISVSPSTIQRGIRLKDQILLPEPFLERRSTSIVEGVQGLPAEVASVPPPPLGRKSSLPETLWTQISTRAPDAARSLDQFLHVAEEDGSELVSLNESSLRVSEFRPPPVAASVAFLVGLVLLIAYRLRSTSDATEVPVSEQDTVIRNRAAESTERSTQLAKPGSSIAR